MCDHKSESSGALARAEPSASHSSESSRGLVTDVACALLQQAAERLDRLRKVPEAFTIIYEVQPLQSFVINISAQLQQAAERLGRLRRVLFLL